MLSSRLGFIFPIDWLLKLVDIKVYVRKAVDIFSFSICLSRNASRFSFADKLFSSVAQLYLTFCDPMDCGTPGFPVHHQLLEPAQTNIHWISDAIQPSHPLSSPSPLAFNLTQHQGLFQRISASHHGQNIEVSASASILPILSFKATFSHSSFIFNKW